MPVTITARFVTFYQVSNWKPLVCQSNNSLTVSHWDLRSHINVGQNILRFGDVRIFIDLKWYHLQRLVVSDEFISQ